MLSRYRTSKRACVADREQSAILGTMVSKPHVGSCLFSKSLDIIYYLEVTMASFTTFTLCESPLIPISTFRLPRFTRNTNKSFSLVAMNQRPYSLLVFNHVSCGANFWMEA